MREERFCVCSRGKPTPPDDRAERPGPVWVATLGGTLALRRRNEGTQVRTLPSKRRVGSGREAQCLSPRRWVLKGSRVGFVGLLGADDLRGPPQDQSLSLPIRQRTAPGPAVSLPPSLPNRATQSTCGPELSSPSSPMSTSSSGSVSTKGPAGRLRRASPAVAAASGPRGLLSGLSGPSGALDSS